MKSSSFFLHSLEDEVFIFPIFYILPIACQDLLVIIMSRHLETNPHFELPQRSEGPPRTLPTASPGITPPRTWGTRVTHEAPPLRRRDQQHQPPGPRGKKHQSERSKPQGPPGGQIPGDGKSKHPRKQPVPLEDQHSQPHDPRHGGGGGGGAGYTTPWMLPRHTGETHPAHYPPLHETPVHDPQRFHSPWIPVPQHQVEDHRRPQKTPSHHQDDQPDKAKIATPQGQGQDHYPIHTQGSDHPPTHQQGHHRKDLRTPVPQRTRLITWIGAAICAIFWIVIFLGGLIVLIVYLVYRPRSPRFEVSSATLNSAYLDAGSLLNADISLLVNFTNPNKKVNVDFKHVILDLYYGNTLIATQYMESFSAARAVSTFANIHMVTSQVRLPLGESARLQDQSSRNGIILDVKGVFRVRSNLGSFLRYSYRLYGHCAIMVTAPPSGVLRATRCKTKR